MVGTQKLTLYSCVAEKDLKMKSITLGAVQVVPAFALLHGDLGLLIGLLYDEDFAKQKQDKWWVARVKCSPEQVVPQPYEWYEAREDIIVPDGYIPLEDALIRYSGIAQNA